MKIFLDDVRNPKDCLGYMYQRIGNLNPIYNEEWLVCRNYNDFIKIVHQVYSKLETITHISFDHDLADEHYNFELMGDEARYNALRSGFKEKTGYDAAKWFISYYEEFGDNPPVPFPEIIVHSMNPVGRKNIEDLFK